jgi:DNA polymerase-3 subunit alpha (Gram-positive type)
MISSFERIFDDKEKANQYAVTNTITLLDSIEQVTPVKDDLYTPKLPDGEKEFLDLVKENTKKLYGDNPPKEIQDRIDKEINSITTHGFGVIYYLSSLAVRKSLEDGYLVGSRGSVGSSMAATLSDITEVNPLRPHYRCEKCKHVEFNDEVSCGFDLEDKSCPKCGETMKGDGHDIPFETFLGFEGDKVPDIDLNFSGEYQPKIHLFIRDFLGEKFVFRAGTISTVAQKTAYGHLINYFEQKGEKAPSRTNMEYLASLVQGTKRTTGQHPGGLIVVPKDLDIEDFTPINYPGNDVNSE